MSHALPSRLNLQSVHEMAWMQESHRLRLLSMAHEKLQDKAFLEKLFNLEDLHGLTAKDIEDFKQFTLFRIANHDFKKGTLENSVGLTRIKGVDVARLNGPEKATAKSIINAVNDSGWFIEHNIHDFIFERDEHGIILTGAEKIRRQKLGSLAAHFEHALDLHDRHLAAKVSSEWNRPMKKGSEWIDELVRKLNPTRLWDNNNASKEFETLISTKRVSQFIENEIDGHNYHNMTKGFGVEDYLKFRRSNVALDYTEIVKAKRMAVVPPRVLEPFLPRSGVINQTNVEDLTQKILTFSEKNKFRAAKNTGLFLKGASKFANGVGRVAAPVQIVYGTYVFATSGDLGKGLGAGLGISDAGANDETSLDHHSQQNLFFGLSRQEQVRLLRSVPEFKNWFERQFLQQPIETQIGLLCQDSSLSEFFQTPCMREVRCKGSLPAQFDFKPMVSESQRNIKLHYMEDPLRPYPQVQSLNIYSDGHLQQSFEVRSKEKLDGVVRSNKALKHWILTNRKVFERACKYNKMELLVPQIPKESRRDHSAFQVFLGYLNQQHRTENPELNSDYEAKGDEQNQ